MYEKRIVSDFKLDVSVSDLLNNSIKEIVKSKLKDDYKDISFSYCDFVEEHIKRGLRYFKFDVGFSGISIKSPNIERLKEAKKCLAHVIVNDRPFDMCAYFNPHNIEESYFKYYGEHIGVFDNLLDQFPVILAQNKHPLSARCYIALWWKFKTEGLYVNGDYTICYQEHEDTEALKSFFSLNSDQYNYIFSPVTATIQKPEHIIHRINKVIEGTVK